MLGCCNLFTIMQPEDGHPFGRGPHRQIALDTAARVASHSRLHREAVSGKIALMDRAVWG